MEARQDSIIAATGHYTYTYPVTSNDWCPWSVLSSVGVETQEVSTAESDAGNTLPETGWWLPSAGSPGVGRSLPQPQPIYYPLPSPVPSLAILLVADTLRKRQSPGTIFSALRC